MFLLSFLLLFHFPTTAKTFRSGSLRTNLIELYSSEGCSSCPPADRWLASLKKHPKLWKNFIPIEFHVDYWNQLGWTDPFSTKSFSHRQRLYSKEWRVQRVYTPGFVLNGKEWKPTSQKFHQLGKVVGVLSAKTLSPNRFKIEFTPKDQKRETYKLYATLLGNGLITKVPRGENAGRTLRHEFVVLHYQQKNLKKTNNSYVTEIELKSIGKKKPQSLSVAFWVSQSHSLKPIQAVGGNL